MVFCEGGSIFKVHPRDRHGSPLKRDGSIDHLDAIHGGLVDQHDHPGRGLLSQDHRQHALGQTGSVKVLTFQEAREPFIDRKSTRLNSSHTVISYAVFCLKKKKKKKQKDIMKKQ